MTEFVICRVEADIADVVVDSADVVISDGAQVPRVRLRPPHERG